jgi:hypothetical protein
VRGWWDPYEACSVLGYNRRATFPANRPGRPTRFAAAYHVNMGKGNRRREGFTIGDLVDSLGPTIIGAALVIVLILMAWGCHSGTS